MKVSRPRRGKQIEAKASHRGRAARITTEGDGSVNAIPQEGACENTRGGTSDLKGFRMHRESTVEGRPFERSKKSPK